MEDEHADWTPYQRMEAGILKDISHDTDTILDKLEEKDMGDSFDSGMLAGLLGNRGIDPGIVAMLNNRCKDGMWGDGGMLTLLFLIILLGGRYGFNNLDSAGVSGVDRTVVNEANYSRMMDAINGNRTAMEQLAQTLNCDVQAINSSLCGIDKQIAVNQGSIINAVQSCCCNLQGKIDQCCCQTNLNIERTGNSIMQKLQENNFAMANYFAAQTQLITDKFCALEKRELETRLHDLELRNSELRAEAQTAIILNAVNGARTASGTLNTTAGTWTGSVTASS